MKIWILPMIAALGLSCGNPRQEPSDLNDVGLWETFSLNKFVIYGDQDKFYLKTCNQDTPLPLSRDCIGTVEKSLPAQFYLDSILLETGPFARTDEGLVKLEELLERVRQDADSDNPEAHRRLEQLTEQKANLEDILRLRDQIVDHNRHVSFLDYDRNFKLLFDAFKISHTPQNIAELLSWFDNGRVPNLAVFDPNQPLAMLGYYQGLYPSHFHRAERMLYTIVKNGKKYADNAVSQEIFQTHLESPEWSWTPLDSSGNSANSFWAGHRRCATQSTFRQITRLGTNFLIQRVLETGACVRGAGNIKYVIVYKLP